MNVVPKLVACIVMSVLPAMFAAPAPAPLAVEDVNNPAFQPFQIGETLSFTVGTVSRGVNIPVPAGKRLVIEFVSFLSFLPTGQIPANSIRVNNAVTHYFLTPLQGSFPSAAVPSGLSQFICSTPTRLYCDPGSSVFVVAERSSAESGGSVLVSISGYYVNVP